MTVTSSPGTLIAVVTASLLAAPATDASAVHTKGRQVAPFTPALEGALARNWWWKRSLRGMDAIAARFPRGRPVPSAP
jgi:hypothetical protein